MGAHQREPLTRTVTVVVLALLVLLGTAWVGGRVLDERQARHRAAEAKRQREIGKAQHLGRLRDLRNELRRTEWHPDRARVIGIAGDR